MTEYDVLYNDAKEKLSKERFNHSVGVVKRAVEYASIYNVDLEMVKKVAIVHDIAKELTDDEKLKYLEKYNIKLTSIEKANNTLVHAKIGYYICKYEYNFTDDMANAVKYHTTGRSNMSILEKIIYLADATEENRKHCPSTYVDLIKKDIDKGMVEITKWVTNSLFERNKIISLETIECYNYYCSKVNICKSQNRKK